MGKNTARGEGWVIAQLILLVLLALVPRGGPAWPRPLAMIARLIGLPICLGGGWISVRAFGALGPSLTLLPRPKPDGTFVRDGVYAIIRHPIYSGVTSIALGLALLTASNTRLLIAVTLAAFFNAKADREEAWLRERFPDYAAYCEEVPKLWPSPW